jgi:hypothetical protein
LPIKDAITVGGSLDLEAGILKDGFGGLVQECEDLLVASAKAAEERQRVSGHPTLGLCSQPEIGCIFDMFFCLQTLKLLEPTWQAGIGYPVELPMLPLLFWELVQ